VSRVPGDDDVLRSIEERQMAMWRKLAVPVLVGVMVAGILGGGSGVVAGEPRVTTASLMIPAGAFVPAADGGYFNYGEYIATGSGTATFSAPLFFPVPVVNIKKLTIYAYDNTGGIAVCAWVYRSRPTEAAEDFVANTCTVDSTASPQVRYATATGPRRVNTATQSAYLWVYLDGPGIKLFGARVNYSY
jgi:hypothetical protein